MHAVLTHIQTHIQNPTKGEGWNEILMVPDELSDWKNTIKNI